VITLPGSHGDLFALLDPTKHVAAVQLFQLSGKDSLAEEADRARAAWSRLARPIAIVPHVDQGDTGWRKRRITPPAKTPTTPSMTRTTAIWVTLAPRRRTTPLFGRVLWRVIISSDESEAERAKPIARSGDTKPTTIA
jgi:hypothetical protein